MQIANAEESLKAETNADVVRDVRVRLQPLRRRARLVYFPAYIVQYTFGEVLAETGERRPQHFMAVISGMGARLCSLISKSCEADCWAASVPGRLPVWDLCCLQKPSP